MNITLTEIKDQYRSLEKTIALVKQRSEALASFYKEVSPRAIVFTGCGSSYMLSCSMRSIASVRADIPVYALASGDLWLNSENYRPMLRDALIVSLSRSGCTSEVVNAYETVAAMNVGAKFMSLTCAEDTPLEKLSDFTLAMPWNFDQSVCQTRCVSNLYAAGAMAVGEMMGDKAVVEGFEALAADGDAYLERIEPQLRQIADPVNRCRAVDCCADLSVSKSNITGNRCHNRTQIINRTRSRGIDISDNLIAADIISDIDQQLTNASV